MQARFVCLAHNLMVLLDAKIGIEDDKETERAGKRWEAAARSGTPARCYLRPSIPKPA